MMHKKKNSRTFETEYSSSFRWNHSDMDNVHNNAPTQLVNVIIDGSHRSPILDDRKVHQFRHKLKLALLEKLERLESEYALRMSWVDSDDQEDQSAITPSNRQRSKKSHNTNTDTVRQHSEKRSQSRPTADTRHHRHRRSKNKVLTLRRWSRLAPGGISIFRSTTFSPDFHWSNFAGLNFHWSIYK